MAKRTVLVGAACAVLGLALGSAWAGPPPVQVPPSNGLRQHPAMIRALGEINAAISDLSDAPSDPGGHRDKALEWMKKGAQELRDALSNSHEHNHNDEKGKH